MDNNLEHLILNIIRDIVLNTSGVYGFAENLTEQLSKSILGIDSPNKGIRINKDKDGYIIDLFVVVEFGSNIPEVAWNIQENVAKYLRDILYIDLSKIDIHVQGVSFKKILKDDCKG
ncbi:Asp23/Gls24 family envelope stress response protein [Eubacteriales bacterium KG127]